MTTSLRISNSQEREYLHPRKQIEAFSPERHVPERLLPITGCAKSECVGRRKKVVQKHHARTCQEQFLTGKLTCTASEMRY